MRRAAVQALRTTSRRSLAVRRAITYSYHPRYGGSVSTGSTTALSTASFSTGSPLAVRLRQFRRSVEQTQRQLQQQQPSQRQNVFNFLLPPQHVRILESAVLFKQFATFIAGLIAAGGAYWAFGTDGAAPSSSPFNGLTTSAGFPASNAAANSALTALGHSVVSPSELSAASGVGSAQPTDATSSEGGSISSSEAEATRRALVVENDQFFAGDIEGDEPLSKTVDASGRLVVEMLTPGQATEKLRKLEQSYLIGRGQGVVRYDVTQLPSNNPIEDDHAEKIVEHADAIADGSKSDWMFWGVFDGHSGWTTSAKLRQVLISFVTRELTATYSSAASASTPGLPSPEAIDAAIKNGFVRLDHEIVHESVNKLMKNGKKAAAAELLAPALSGSCALLSFYDAKSKLLRVACAGDSRAVLGRRSGSGKWVATALSEDLTGGTPSEEARLRREHPGEEFVVRNGRILGGLEPSRAFGDAIYKWSVDTQKAIKSRWLGRSGSPLLKTPPYVTAEPVVTTTRIEPEKGDFVVMATDGLWECLTNEEVVGLVGQWIERNAAKLGSGNAASGSAPSAQSTLFSTLFGAGGSGSKTALPVENHSGTGSKGGGAGGNGPDGQRAPIRQQQYNITQGDERFVVEDKNAATHLVRNALGGRDRDMFCALLTLPSPFSRRYRDDLTVEVIFFGDSALQANGGAGDIVQNIEASSTSGNEKAKL